MRQDRHTAGRGAGRVLLALVLSGSAVLHAGQSPMDASAAQPGHLQRLATPSGLEMRVHRLTKALGLDAEQAISLRRILENQRDQVRQIWSDNAVASAYRIAATEALVEHTGDAIRAILNEDQKQKYNLTRPTPELSAASSKPSVSDWMGAAQHD